jgi:hypothetical protein
VSWIGATLIQASEKSLILICSVRHGLGEYRLGIMDMDVYALYLTYL